MASATVTQHPFPVGASVSAYRREQRSPGGGSPTGTAAATATVSTAGVVTFTGLTEGVDYVASAVVSGAWRHVDFGADEVLRIPTPEFSSLDLDDVLVWDGSKVTGSTRLQTAETHVADVALDGGPHGLPALTADGQAWVRQAGGLLAVDVATQAELEVERARLLSVESTRIDPRSAAYGAVGNGSTNDTTALQAAATALQPGWVLDLGGRTYAVTSPITFAVANVEVRNGKVLAIGDSGRHRTAVVTAADVTFRSVRFERSVSTPSPGTDTSDVQSSVVVAGLRSRFHDCDFTNAALACLYLTAATADGAWVKDCRLSNSSSVQNSAGIYGSSVADTPCADHLIEGNRVTGGCSHGVLINNANRCRVHGNFVSGMRRVAPGVASGYGITLYQTAGVFGPLDNVVAHNHVEDVDGFGIYFQFGAEAQNNSTRGNTLRNCNKLGAIEGSLPWAALTISGGTNTICDGDQIYDAGGDGVKVGNGATGKLVGTVVVSSGGSGIWVLNGGFDVLGCTSNSNVSHGIVLYQASTTLTDNRIVGCVAKSNGDDGIGVGAATCTIKGAVVDGCLAASNADRGIIIDGTTGATDCKVVNNNSHDNGSGTSYQIDVVGANLQGIHVSGNSVWSGIYGIRLTACPELMVGPNTIGAGFTTPISGTVTSGSPNPPTLAGIAINGAAASSSTQRIRAGRGTPEAAVKGNIGDEFMRDDGGAGTSHYVKESGYDTDTGWVAK